VIPLLEPRMYLHYLNLAFYDQTTETLMAPYDFSEEEKKTQSLLLCQDCVMDLMFVGLLNAARAGADIEDCAIRGI